MRTRFALGSARISKKGARWHSGGHPWIYSDDVEEVDEGRGFVVRVFGPDQRELGLACWSPQSKIALRMLERGAGHDLEDRMAWFAARLDAAIERRAPLRDESNAMRLVSSEADGLPGLIVDRYADVLVLQSLTPFIEEHLDHIVPSLVQRTQAAMVLARNDVRVRDFEGLPRGIDILHGTRREHVEIQEHGLRLRVDPFTGQKTGYFLDQRPARELVMQRARGSVLDLFCYIGGFALHAARGGAERVVAIDSSARAIQEVEAGAARNGLEDRVEARQQKANQALEALAAEGARFDGIIVDPPAFAKSRAQLEGAERGYLDLNAKAMRLLAPGGWMLCCSCSANMRPARFQSLLAEAAARARRGFLDRGRLQPALDHPVLLGLPESDYLKVHLLEALD